MHNAYRKNLAKRENIMMCRIIITIPHFAQNEKMTQRVSFKTVIIERAMHEAI
jgi:hypothetical protein